jgi:ABC-type sugar transport system permease subunit
MTIAPARNGRPAALSTPRSKGWMRFLLLPLVLALDVLTAVWAWSALGQGLWLIGSVIILVVVGINVGALVLRATALRWMLPTLAFLVAFALAPIVYTAYVALTNYNGTHLLTQQQAVAALERQTYTPKDAIPYAWTAYQAGDGKLALYLVPMKKSGGGDRFALADGASRSAAPGTGIFGPADGDGFPLKIDGYTRLNPIQKVQRINEISAARFGQAPTIYHVVSASQAAPTVSQYRIHADGSVTDVTTGTVYRPQASGYYESSAGKRIQPAFQNFVGLDNVVRLFTDDRVRGPFLTILIWTIVFAILVVLIQFALSLLYAVVLTSRFVHPRAARAIRAVLLLPYVIPAYLMILTWASMFNSQTGLIPSVLQSAFGIDPSWIGTSAGARIAMLIVGVWLGFPYFLLINTGALQSIPGELIEAASVDGASPWRRFRAIVFPLLMRTIAPLLVLAFAFNFNNFYLAYLLFRGGPPMPNAQVSAGDTDLLISFTYKVSFGSVGGGNDYALAAVITSLIFVALTPIVLSQLRYYNRWRNED